MWSKFLKLYITTTKGGGGLVAKLCPTLSTPWTVACQATLSMGFSRQEYRSGLPFPSPGNLPDPGTEPKSPALQADSLLTELSGNLPSKEKCIKNPVKSKYLYLNWLCGININFLVLTTHCGWLCKILSLGEARWRVPKGQGCQFCTFSSFFNGFSLFKIYLIWIIFEVFTQFVITFFLCFVSSPPLPRIKLIPLHWKAKSYQLDP